MNLADLKEYLIENGWSEMPSFADHFAKESTKGIVAIDFVANQAFTLEYVGSIPWCLISSIEQFECDLAHLQHESLTFH
ncbi:hypothetical protein [Vibrio sp. Hal054]|uniref:hypothetical protein n=1 Tax=Vibrio sp. Hal054 TaxID=3035158 RepID=UPI00301C55A7